MSFEEYAVRKYPKTGKCNGRNFHRVGLIPVRSLLDGGLPGDVCNEYCLSCGKHFAGTAFLPIRQPSVIQG